MHGNAHANVRNAVVFAALRRNIGRYGDSLGACRHRNVTMGSRIALFRHRDAPLNDCRDLPFKLPVLFDLCSSLVFARDLGMSRRHVSSTAVEKLCSNALLRQQRLPQ